jgi:sporulation protein YlmC with PRC-barrel domain
MESARPVPWVRGLAPRIAPVCGLRRRRDRAVAKLAHKTRQPCSVGPRPRLTGRSNDWNGFCVAQSKHHIEEASTGMRVDLDARVKTRDGESAGSVQRAIFDPHSDEITDFVISTGGLLGHDVLVPRERLEASNREGNTICLDLTRDELKKMPEYVAGDYAEPASGWVPPIGYSYGSGGYLWPAGYIWPVEIPRSQSHRDVDGELSPAIAKGSIVRDRNGDEVGLVEDLRLDPATGQLDGLVLRAGGTIQTFFGGGETREIEGSQLEYIAPGSVLLRLSKDELAR